MSDVKIYITSYNKPEFIGIQVFAFNTHCKDDFELIIINNGIDAYHAEEIRNKCKLYELKCINVIKRSEEEYSSQSHAQALEYALNVAIRNDHSKGINVILDNDIFPYKQFSFVEMMNGKLLGGIHQQREGHDYIAAIFLMMDRSLDLSHFSFHAGIGDTGAAVQMLIRMYNITPEYVSHTAQIDIESEYIFTCENPIPYKEKYRSQFIGNALFHYYRGSNWSESDPEYHKEKWQFTLNLLANYKSYCLNLDDNVHYPRAHSDKSYNGSDHNYRNYRFIDMKKPS